MLQILPSTNDSQENNLQKGIDYCKKAALMNADIALFPEIWNCGYNLSGTAEQIKSRAISSDSSFVQTFANLAKELNMAIGITFLEKTNALPANSFVLFDRHGNNCIVEFVVFVHDGTELLTYVFFGSEGHNKVFSEKLHYVLV